MSKDCLGLLKGESLTGDPAVGDLAVGQRCGQSRVWFSGGVCTCYMQGMTDQLTLIKHVLGTTLCCQQSKPSAQRQTDSDGTIS